MAKPTSIIQPIVYEMMVLAQALTDLRKFVDCKTQDPSFPSRESALGSALIRIRSLAEFWGGTDPNKTGKPTKGKDIMTVESMSPQWQADTSFYAACWQPISEYVDHLIDKRYKKTTKQPKARDAQRWGQGLLTKTQNEIDGRVQQGEISLVGDAEGWYRQFKRLFQAYLANQTS